VALSSRSTAIAICDPVRWVSSGSSKAIGTPLATVVPAAPRAWNGGLARPHASSRPTTNRPRQYRRLTQVQLVGRSTIPQRNVAVRRHAAEFRRTRHECRCQLPGLPAIDREIQDATQRSAGIGRKRSAYVPPTQRWSQVPRCSTSLRQQPAYRSLLGARLEIERREGEPRVRRRPEIGLVAERPDSRFPRLEFRRQQPPFVGALGKIHVHRFLRHGAFFDGSDLHDCLGPVRFAFAPCAGVCERVDRKHLTGYDERGSRGARPEILHGHLRTNRQNLPPHFAAIVRGRHMADFSNLEVLAENQSIREEDLAVSRPQLSRSRDSHVHLLALEISHRRHGD